MNYSTASSVDWRDRAACADKRYTPIVDFWHANDSDTAEIRTATTICGHCPVRDACLTSALTEEKGSGEQYTFGIRGGLTSKQRRNRQRREARRRQRDQTGLACGTTQRYYQHVTAGEPVDAACQAASDAAEQQSAEKSQRQPAACGTRSGYQKHRARGEQACDACHKANADADRRLRNTGTTKQLVS